MAKRRVDVDQAAGRSTVRLGPVRSCRRSLKRTCHAAQRYHTAGRPQCWAGHGSGSDPAAGVYRVAIAVQQRLPGGRAHPGVAGDGAGGPVSRRLGNAGARQPFAGDTRPCLLSPVRKSQQSCGTRRCRQHPCCRAVSRRSSGGTELAIPGRGSAERQGAGPRAYRRRITWHDWGMRSKSRKPDQFPAA
jgi:hypothetical protein